MLRMVDHCNPLLLASMVPATPEESTCVVLTGYRIVRRKMVHIATISADAPWAYVKWVFPIFSPTVTTMRFQPTMVPSPSAIATETLTQGG